jgi:hypothetical protein
LVLLKLRKLGNGDLVASTFLKANNMTYHTRVQSPIQYVGTKRPALHQITKTEKQENHKHSKAKFIYKNCAKKRMEESVCVNTKAIRAKNSGISREAKNHPTQPNHSPTINRLLRQQHIKPSYKAFQIPHPYPYLKRPLAISTLSIKEYSPIAPPTLPRNAIPQPPQHRLRPLLQYVPARHAELVTLDV